MDAPIEGDGLAIAGLVLGYVQVLSGVAVVVFILAMLFTGLGWMTW